MEVEEIKQGASMVLLIDSCCAIMASNLSEK